MTEQHPNPDEPIYTTFRRLVWAVVCGNFIGAIIGMILWAFLAAMAFPD